MESAPKVNLVTAVCGIGIGSDFNRQEELNVPVIFSQIVSGIGILKESGSMILKGYMMTLKVNHVLIWVLTMIFEKVFIVKPATSRARNSEVYLACIRKKKYQVI